MSNPKPDGGPAFPFPTVQLDGGGSESGSMGMSLRDWFAGQALIGLMASEKMLLALVRQPGGPEVLPAAAYELADAMLAERDK